MIDISDALEQLDMQLLELIETSFGVQTTSFSSFQCKVTGNAYQSVRVRDKTLPGFRASDENIYSGLQITGKTLVDLGCNLGERTRIAARNGALFAEGVEYEELFVRIGSLISVYNKAERILLRHGDITQPGCLSQDYDIVACFSAFVYARQNLGGILSRAKDLFILETHALANGWFAQNIAVVAPIMPHWVLYDITDHGTTFAAGKRACVAFARNPAQIRTIAEVRARELGERNKNLAQLDLARSPRIVGMCGDPELGTKEIFERLRAQMQLDSAPTPGSIAARLSHTADELEAVPNRDERFAKNGYWIGLLRGIGEYVERGCITSENTYLSLLRRICQAGIYDPGMLPVLSDMDSAIARVTLRLNALVRVLTTRSLESDPAIVYNAMAVEAVANRGLSTDHIPPNGFIADVIGNSYAAQVLDGYHRLATLYLSGASCAPCTFVWTAEHPTQLQVRAEAAKADDKTTTISWSDRRVGQVVEDTVELLFR